MPHWKIVTQAGLSALVTFACAAAEFVRFVQEAALLTARWDAEGRGQLVEWDLQFPHCEYFVPGTDVPQQPAAYGTTPGWHMLTAIFLVVIGLAEIPHTSWFVTHFGVWCIIFSETAGTWYTGVLQMQIATAMLSTSIYAIGSAYFGFARYIVALAMFGIGFSNLLLGMLFGSELRVWRRQIGSDEEESGKSANQKCREAFEVLDAVLGSLNATTAIGPFFGLRAAFRKALKQLGD